MSWNKLLCNLVRYMDVTQALKDTENVLRDTISDLLSKKYGKNWAEKSGVSAERIEKWNQRLRDEEKQQISGVVEERIIYYADFYDIKTILEKRWADGFSDIFGKFKTMEVWLSELEKIRNPDAHRRELLPHQKHLVLGIAGEIRTRLIRYRSKMETSEDYFPRIESVRDSIGNILTYGGSKNTSNILRVGDTIEFLVTASDPLGGEIEYALTVTGHHHNPEWQKENSFEFTFNNSHIRKTFGIMLWIRCCREHHAHGYYDDSSTFTYDVLPKK